MPAILAKDTGERKFYITYLFLSEPRNSWVTWTERGGKIYADQRHSSPNTHPQRKFARTRHRRARQESRTHYANSLALQIIKPISRSLPYEFISYALWMREYDSALIAAATTDALAK